MAAASPHKATCNNRGVLLSLHEGRWLVRWGAAFGQICTNQSGAKLTTGALSEGKAGAECKTVNKWSDNYTNKQRCYEKERNKEHGSVDWYKEEDWCWKSCEGKFESVFHRKLGSECATPHWIHRLSVHATNGRPVSRILVTPNLSGWIIVAFKCKGSECRLQFASNNLFSYE